MPPKASGRRGLKKQRVGPAELPAPVSVSKPVPAEPVEDHFDADLELESLFKLNFDAASGELPKLPTPNETEPAPLDAANAGQATSAAVPVAARDAVAAFLPKAADRSRNTKQKKTALGPRAFAQYGSFGQETEVVCSVKVEDLADPLPQHKLINRQADDREAISALVKSLQPFIERDNSGEDTPFPLALPAPSGGAGDISALKDFRDQMTDRHRLNEVSLPIEDDVGRFLLELEVRQMKLAENHLPGQEFCWYLRNRECAVSSVTVELFRLAGLVSVRNVAWRSRYGVGIHLQLPSLAFPSLPCENKSEDVQFVQVGTLRIDPGFHTVQLRSTVQNKAFDFDISQQNVPSTNAEVFFFSHPKTGEETGKVKIHSADTDVSLSGTISVSRSATTGNDRSRRLHGFLSPLMHTKQNVKSAAVDRKRPFEVENGDAVPGSSSKVHAYPHGKESVTSKRGRPGR